MKTILPDALSGEGFGYAAVCDAQGDTEGVVTVRASKTVPGYVTLVSTCELGKAIRVPANWLTALDGLPLVEVL